MTLARADAVDFLAELEVPDHIVTDPPYGAAVDAGFRSGARRAARNLKGAGVKPAGGLGIGIATDETIAKWAQAMGTARRWVIVFSDVESCHLWRLELQSAGLRYLRTIAWDRVNGAPQFSGDRPAAAFEVATVCHGQGERLRWNAGGKRGLYRWPRPVERSGHPTEKPLELMESIVRDFTDPGELVADPFMGSGTTGVACARLGRRFAGCDREQQWVDLARDRIERTHEQRELRLG